MVSKLQSLDRRLIYLLLVIVMAAPLIHPVSIPVFVSASTKSAFSVIDSLEDGDIIVVMPNYTPNAKAENHPQLEAMVSHALQKKGVKIVTCSFWEMGPLFAHELFQTFGDDSLVYGEDYVELGYAPGGETAISAFANDIHKTFPTDYYGTPIGQSPLMQNLKTAEDIALIVSSESGTPGTPELVRQVQSPFKTPIVGGYAAQFAPTYEPYLGSGQIQGFLAGLRGAMEYEILTERPGQGSSGFGAVTFAMLSVIALVILSNALYFANRKGFAGRDAK